MTELKPCPFCGGTKLTVKSSARWGHFVSCRCTAVGPGRPRHDDAVKAWNDRPEPGPVQDSFDFEEMVE